MKKKNMGEQAREQGVSISTLKQRFEREREAKAVREATYDLMRAEMTAGWNPRAGNRKRNKGF